MYLNYTIRTNMFKVKGTKATKDHLEQNQRAPRKKRILCYDLIYYDSIYYDLIRFQYYEPIGGNV